MSRNILTELQDLVGSQTAKDKIVEVISYDTLTRLTTYKSRSGTGTFVSTDAHSPGDNLVLNDNNVIGIAEALSNTVWID